MWGSRPREKYWVERKWLAWYLKPGAWSQHSTWATCRYISTSYTKENKTGPHEAICESTANWRRLLQVGLSHFGISWSVNWKIKPGVWWSKDSAAHQKCLINSKILVKNVLGNTWAENYTKNVQKLGPTNRLVPSCNMSIKLHFVYRHLHNFPENLYDVGDKQG